jgi:hypothetical protein
LSNDELGPLKPDVVVSETTTGTRTYPPYNCSPSWIKTFFELAKSMKISVIDRKFVENYIIGQGNQSKVTNALKFLQLADSNGQATDKVNLLKTEGETFKQNLRRIVEEAYADLMTNIDVKLARPDWVYGYFTAARWNYTLDQAKDATKFFVWLAKEAGIEVSADLATVKSDPKARESREQRTKKENMQTKDDVQDKEPMPITRVITKTLPTTQVSTGSSNIQATINMSLDKETPVEVWRMVLKLLGLKDADEPAKDDLPN